jgi:hypothetical protein
VQIDDAVERSNQEETKRLLFPLACVASGESKGVAIRPNFTAPSTGYTLVMQ